MSEPTTPTGRLLASEYPNLTYALLVKRILAIEAEARREGIDFAEGYAAEARADALDVVRKRFADAFMVHPTGRMTDAEVLAILAEQKS